MKEGYEMDALKVKLTMWEKLWKIAQYVSLVALMEFALIAFVSMA